MVCSLFILDGESGDVVLEKHYRPGGRTSAELFWEEVCKRSKREDVPPILLSARSYLVSIYRGGLFFLASLAAEAPPLATLEFLHRVYDVFSEYFGGGPLTRRSITAHFSTCWLLLDEMLDGGHPLITQPNALHGLIAPPTLASKLSNFMTGKATNVSDTLGAEAMSLIPWRKAGVRYASNELNLEVQEELDAAYDANGAQLKADVRGNLVVHCHLSGTPDLILTFASPRGLLEDVSFHPCVRLSRWEREGVVSFVPPDGTFTLMSYRVAPEKAALASPVYCRPAVSWRDGGSGKAVFTLGVKPLASASATVSYSSGGSGISSASSSLVGPSELDVEDVALAVTFPSVVKTLDLSSDAGSVTTDLASNRVTWTLGRFPRDGSGRHTLPELTGSLFLAPGAPCPPLEAPFASLTFTIPGQAASGLTIRDVVLTPASERYKFSKGIKSTLKAGHVHFRA